MKLEISTTSLLLALPMVSAFLAPGNPTRAALRVTTDEATETVTSDSKLNLHKKVVDPMGLYPKNSREFQTALQEEQANVIANNERPIYDPMNLYTANTAERQEGLVQAMEPPIEIVNDTRDPLGLYPEDSAEFMASLEKEKGSLGALNREVYDPFGLYPESSAEYQDGTIKVLEPELKVVNPVTDPMGLYSRMQAEEVNRGAVMSTALPFMVRPALLDGELAGDAGFDPLGFAKSKEGLLWQRQAELKHSRIAMLAAVGWPLSEMLHRTFSSLLHLQPILVEGGRVPSLLNGGLQQVNPFYWMGILAVTGLFEAVDMMKQDSSTAIFDPLGLYPADAEGKKWVEEIEIRNGRLAMLAITAYAAIEAVTHQAIV